MSASLLELQQKAERKTADMLEFLSKRKTEKMDENGKPLFDMDTQSYQEVQEKRAEIEQINSELQKARAQQIFLETEAMQAELKEIERKGSRDFSAVSGAARPARDYRGSEPGDRKSLGQMVTDSNAYQFKGSGPRFGLEMPDVDVKTTITTAAGYAPVNARTNLVVDYPNRKPMVRDLIPIDNTENSIIKWMEMTTFDNQFAGTAQGAQKPEVGMAWAERTSLVEKIAGFVPVTEEQVDDVPGFQGIINRDLMLMLMLSEENMLLNGNGSSPQIDGFLHKSGVQSRAQTGADDNQDTIFKAFTDIRWTGYAEPSGIVMNPTNWQTIRLQRTTEGLYIFGDPATEGTDRLWGKSVVVTNAISAGTALIGDFANYAHISQKMGVRVDVSDSHNDFFIKNLLAIRAELRESLEIKRPTAFEKVTSLN